MATQEYAPRVTPMGIPATRLDDLPDLIEIQKKSFISTSMTGPSTPRCL